MIGQRTRYSIAQFLELQSPDVVAVLLRKHGAQFSFGYDRLLIDLSNVLTQLDGNIILQVLAECISTSGDLRSRVDKKYRFDERMHDLTQCLLLDGYAIQNKQLVQMDPSIAGATPIDDDLSKALATCGAPRAPQIIQKINDSAAAFRRATPDYNASLTDARIALETLASDIAQHLVPLGSPVPFDPTSWGQVLNYLKSSGEITVEEEVGLAGVFRFLSPGAHRPVGISQEQMTRLGRTLALNMCWFLLQNHLIPKK